MKFKYLLSTVLCIFVFVTGPILVKSTSNRKKIYKKRNETLIFFSILSKSKIKISTAALIEYIFKHVWKAVQWLQKICALFRFWCDQPYNEQCVKWKSFHGLSENWRKARRNNRIQCSEMTFETLKQFTSDKKKIQNICMQSAWSRWIINTQASPNTVLLLLLPVANFILLI